MLGSEVIYSNQAISWTGVIRFLTHGDFSIKLATSTGSQGQPHTVAPKPSTLASLYHALKLYYLVRLFHWISNPHRWKFRLATSTGSQEQPHTVVPKPSTLALIWRAKAHSQPGWSPEIEKIENWENLKLKFRNLKLRKLILIFTSSICPQLIFTSASWKEYQLWLFSMLWKIYFSMIFLNYKVPSEPDGIWLNIILVFYLNGSSILHNRDALIDQSFSVLPGMPNLFKRHLGRIKGGKLNLYGKSAGILASARRFLL